MSLPYFPAIATTGFTVAFLHAAIPTHWLPFVLVGRAQHWSHARTLAVVALAGLGHVSLTTVLGVAVVWLGISVNARMGNAFPWLAGGALLALGGYYLWRQWRGKGHSHLLGGHDHHHAGGHGHEAGHGPHGGMQVDTGHGDVEVSVFETNVPPRFRLYFHDAQGKQQPAPAANAVTLTTLRPDGARQTFAFASGQDYLEATTELPEPHEFKVELALTPDGHNHRHELEFVEHDHHHGPGDAHQHTEGHAPDSRARAKFAEALAANRPPPPTSDRVAITSLFLLLTFSPCEGFLPVYLTGIQHGWPGFALLSAILALATLAGMMVFTSLTWLGLEKLKLQFAERYENGILGGLLCLMGILVILFDH